jgi:ATP-binding cassette subfamily F protein uup
VLDEPTNDLDTETLELLESRLIDYEGTVLIVSHDRVFLDNLCSSTLVFEGGGTVREYAGGYSDWKRVVSSRTAEPTLSIKPRKAAPREPRPGPAGPRKLTWAERQELAALPARIEELEREIAALHVAMADPSYKRDGHHPASDRGRQSQ